MAKNANGGRELRKERRKRKSCSGKPEPCQSLCRLLRFPGVGKTHLAIALGVLTAELGHRIYFTSAIDLARRMARALKENRLSREIKNLT